MDYPKFLLQKVCPCSKKILNIKPHRFERTKYCSKVCFYKYRGRRSGLKYVLVKHNPTSFRKGNIPWNTGTKGLIKAWNRGTKGLTKANSGSFKKGENLGIKNSKWRGDDVGYSALHGWVVRNLGKATVCQNNSTHVSKRFEWANISYEYKRDLKDWMSLCSKCHHSYDRNNGWGIATKKFNL